MSLKRENGLRSHPLVIPVYSSNPVQKREREDNSTRNPDCSLRRATSEMKREREEGGGKKSLSARCESVRKCASPLCAAAAPLSATYRRREGEGFLRALPSTNQKCLCPQRGAGRGGRRRRELEHFFCASVCGGNLVSQTCSCHMIIRTTFLCWFAHVQCVKYENFKLLYW